MMESHMMLKHTSRGLVVVLLAAAAGTYAQAQSQGSRAATRTPMGCADLAGLSLDGSTSITSATLRSRSPAGAWEAGERRSEDLHLKFSAYSGLFTAACPIVSTQRRK